jgi:hypothetical protein
VKSTTSLVSGMAALGVIGAAAFGATSIASSMTPGAQVKLAAVGAPSVLPQDPPAPSPAPPATSTSTAPAQDVPSAEQIVNLCNQFTDPGVPYQSKVNLVENGINPQQGRIMERELKKAQQNGNFPETFTVADLQSTGPNMASANVSISGPKFAGPVVKYLVFTNIGGNWLLQEDAALALLQAAAATN